MTDPMRLKVDDRIIRLARWLKKEYPIGPVRLVIFHDSDGPQGLTERQKGRFQISVNRRYPWYAIQDTLIHEWAHALTWGVLHDDVENGHYEEWGVAYARIYRHVYDFGGCEEAMRQGGDR